jgi:hypothetical protein
MRMLLERRWARGFQPIDIQQTFPKVVENHETLREAGGVSADAIVAAVRRLAPPRVKGGQWQE